MQLVSQKAMAMVSQGFSGMGHVSVPQSADKKAQTSQSYPDPATSKTGYSEQKAVVPSKLSKPEIHATGPDKTMANSEKYRSVPAEPLQNDMMSKGGPAFRSGLSPKFPEKKHEVPKVQIGQIDVIIEAAPQPVTKQPPSPAPIDLSSRLYLRRL